MGVGALLLSKGLGETAVSFSSRKIAYLFLRYFGFSCRQTFGDAFS
jgi:hypothetical protein